MPTWVELLALAIVSWLAVAVGGGLLVGRLLDAVSRRLLRRRAGAHGSGRIIGAWPSGIRSRRSRIWRGSASG